MRLQDLAEMDVREMVQQVQEYFGDFIALEPHHFLVPLPRTHLAMQPFAWDFGNSSDAVARMTEGVASLVLSLRRRFLIRCVRWVAAAAAAAAGGARLAVLV
jgi:vacuolar protein sorting-associated protein 45